MDFTLKLTEQFYKKDEISEFTQWGFKFNELKGEDRYADYDYIVDDEFDPVIVINSLEELWEFVYKYEPVIMYSNTIEIYNGYRE